MYSLDRNPVLLPHQVSILQQFFSSLLTRSFFLTGGTALSAFYFGHRESKDFDLFSMEPFNAQQVRTLVEKIASELGSIVEAKVVTTDYQELYLHHSQDAWTQRIDIVAEQPKHFGMITKVDAVRVDSLENIGSNKILTLFGRFEPKDYVDFYTLVTQTKLTFDDLFELAKRKDTGLSEFYLANSIASVDKIETWPSMRIPFDRKAMIAYYQNLAKELLLRIKPKE